jgi:UDP-N-acetylglucosamine acyltransferase
MTTHSAWEILIGFFRVNATFVAFVCDTRGICQHHFADCILPRPLLASPHPAARRVRKTGGVAHRGRGGQVMIHPTAIVHAAARVDPSVAVGPFAVIDAHVSVGAGCRLGPHVYLTGHTEIGSGNRFYAGCVIGEAPQDLKYGEEATRLRIGDNNVFREHVTVHRAHSLAEDTVVGSDNFLMAHSHVGHNAQIGNQVILANGALVAGHVSVADRAFISGHCLLHQFVRVGTLALMQGGSAISKDLPPFCVARGDNHICGLNTVGLRRAGISKEDRLELKRLYHLLFRSGQRLQAALSEGRRQAVGQPAMTLIEFVAAAKRGVCADVHGATPPKEQLLASLENLDSQGEGA